MGALPALRVNCVQKFGMVMHLLSRLLQHQKILRLRVFVRFLARPGPGETNPRETQRALYPAERGRLALFARLWMCRTSVRKSSHSKDARACCSKRQ